MSRIHRLQRPGLRLPGQVWGILLTTLVLLTGCIVPDSIREDGASAPESPIVRPASGIPGAAQAAQVVRVVDGDTIVVSQAGTEYRVRYILIDTPEQGEPFYNEATKLNQLLIGGQTVYLLKDVSETDPYDRLLRYVYTQDGLLVNAEIVRQGMARVVRFPPDTRLEEEIRAAEAEARERKIGIWH